jgi:cleavage stimulation factor subunit 3
VGFAPKASTNPPEAYLHYIRRQNLDGGSDPENARATVIQAYEYVLKECGVDRESGDLWQEYIQFVAEPKFKSPWDVQQQNDTLRKLYQRAVAIPLNNVEMLWKAYDAFESVQNKLTVSI